MNQAMEMFLAHVDMSLPTHAPNNRQRTCLATDPRHPLMIVAGPGTGKTTVLIMRALRLLLVDRILPEQILITTFTKKAAREIRTRLIDWGLPLIDAVRASAIDYDYRAFLDAIDINRFVTGTLDSICEDALSSAREATERPPVVVEPFAANQILSRFGQIRHEMQTIGDELSGYLHRYDGGDYPPRSLGEVTRVVRTIIDRFVQDRVDLRCYATSRGDSAAKAAIVRIFDRYRQELRDSNRMDFPTLEQTVFERIENGRTPDMLVDLRAVLVDEYRDTNPLQESLYFSLVTATEASLTVVGDDDQSLYRFRGATIELFRDFAARCGRAIGTETVNSLQLVENYRSRPEIVDFFNDFVDNDPAFAPARVQPPKTRIIATRPSEEVPVLGMFRATVEQLAVDLADFLHRMFRGGGWHDAELFHQPISCDPDHGDFGDAVLIGHSVAELGSEVFNTEPTPKLPLLLRRELAQRGVAVFNPRGQALKHIDAVKILLGLVLESLDPSSRREPQGRAANLALTNTTKRAFERWRASANTFLAGAPREAKRNTTPDDRIGHWRRVVTTGGGDGSAREWPVLDIIYGFIPWLRAFQDDPEHQVYLEAISRCAAEAATFSAFRATIVANDDVRQASVDQLMYDVLSPIADGLVDPDEEILPSVPRDRLNIMTIHQAKGLEYPLVIVDVSAGFTRDHPKTRFRRFPGVPSNVALLEDDLSECTSIGRARLERSALSRSFDDLVRLFYVAYSRPQSVLLLVGHISTLKYDKAPKNVAAFWRRDATWGWRDEERFQAFQPVPGQRRPRGFAAQIPTEADRVPLTQI